MRAFLALLLLWVSSSLAQAHEVRPAFLSLIETAPSEFTMLWKQPVLEGKRLKITPTFSQDCTLGHATLSQRGATVIETREVFCPLTEGTISLPGLERTLTDVFAQITYLSGESRSALIKPESPHFDLGSETTSVAGQYLKIGVDHIIFGWDHLLFVIGLTLLVTRRQIIGVATAFTLAHSITLGLAAFGLLTLPIRPVEILIAASIDLLGLEIMRKQKGQTSLATKRPYLIGFLIGLIHGCGFASALSEIGLPKGTELLALLLFNIGVELGQFAVIILAIIILSLIAKNSQALYKKTETFLAYGLASIAMFWFMQRLSEYWVV